MSRIALNIVDVVILRALAIATLFSVVFTPLDAQTTSSDACNANPINHDICESARQIQREIAPQLPQQLQQNVTLRSVMAHENTLSFVAMLHYEREVLENAVLQGNRTMVDLAAQMQAMTEQFVCSLPFGDAFIGLGGAVESIYQFIDGEAYLVIRIEEC